MKYKTSKVVASQGSGRLQPTAKRSSSVGSEGALAARSVVAPQGSGHLQSSAKPSSSVGSQGALAARPTIRSDPIEIALAKGALIASAHENWSYLEDQRQTYEMAQDAKVMSDEGINAWGGKHLLNELKKRSDTLPNPSDEKLKEAGEDLERAWGLDSIGVSQCLAPAPMTPIRRPGRTSDQQPLLLWDALANNRHPIRPQVQPLSDQEPFPPQGQSGMPSGNVELSRGSVSDTGLGAVGSMSPNNRHPIRPQVQPLSDQEPFPPQGQLGMPSDNTAAQHQPPTDGSPSVANAEDQNTDEMTSQICEDFQKYLEEQAASEGEATMETAGSSTSSGGSLSAAGVSGDTDHNTRGL